MGYRGKEKKNSNLPEQNLVGVRPVGVGGVKEGDPGTECGLDEGHAVLVGHRGVIDAGEAHAPETDLRHLQHTKLTHQEESSPVLSRATPGGWGCRGWDQAISNGASYLETLSAKFHSWHLAGLHEAPREMRSNSPGFTFRSTLGTHLAALA